MQEVLQDKLLKTHHKKNLMMQEMKEVKLESLLPEKEQVFMDWQVLEIQQENKQKNLNK